MENLTVNQIYKKYVPSKIAFSHWIDFENKLYNDRKKNFKKQISFDDWINRRYASPMLNADSLFDQIVSGANAVSQAINPTDTTLNNTTISDALAKQNAEAAAAKTDTRIFGLQPMAFIGIITVIVIGAGVGIYVLIKKSKHE